MSRRVLARWRVPMGWVVGLIALFVASPTPSWYWAGLGIAALGEGTRLWAAGHLEKNKELATAGPYAWTRNPLYFGSLLMGLGFALAAGRALLLVVVALLFAAVYLPVMQREAARLSEGFGDVYQAYADRVPLFWPWPPSETGDGRFLLERVSKNKEHWTVLGWFAVAIAIGWNLF